MRSASRLVVINSGRTYFHFPEIQGSYYLFEHTREPKPGMTRRLAIEDRHCDPLKRENASSGHLRVTFRAPAFQAAVSTLARATFGQTVTSRCVSILWRLSMGFSSFPGDSGPFGTSSLRCAPDSEFREVWSLELRSSLTEA